MTCLSSQLVDKEFHADKQKQICFSPSIVTEMVMDSFHTDLYIWEKNRKWCNNMLTTPQNNQICEHLFKYYETYTITRIKIKPTQCLKLRCGNLRTCVFLLSQEKQWYRTLIFFLKASTKRYANVCSCGSAAG